MTGSRQAARTLVVVDARNVQRSTWPNISDRRLVTAVMAWRARERAMADVVLCFDGDPTGCGDVLPADRTVQLDAASHADDRIVEIVFEARDAGWRVEAATSDRELRDRIREIGGSVAWGGGAFLRELGLAR